MRFKAVIFDLDDTIHDKSATLRAVGARLHADHQLNQFGVDLDGWISAFVRLNNEKIDKGRVFAQLGEIHSLSSPKVADLLSDFDISLGRQAVAYPGAIECLVACKDAGLRLGLVTNGREFFQRSKLEGMGAARLFDVVLTSGGYGVKKPDPAIFHECLRALGAMPAEAAVVGDDRCCDIDPAIALGMTPVWKSSTVAPDVALCTDDFSVIQAFLTDGAGAVDAESGVGSNVSNSASA